MNAVPKPVEPLLRRFVARGGLNIVMTVVAVPFVYYFLRRWTGLDWFYAVLLGTLISLIVAHIFLLPLGVLALRLLAPESFCEVCPVCSERALAFGMRISEPTEDRTLHRVFQLAHCRRCGLHFHRFNDGTYVEKPKNV
jgi:hypothetical protein